MEIHETLEFSRWLEALADDRARARILVRLTRLALGNPGDVRPIGGGLSKLRIDYGPGYRVYLTSRGSQLVVLLAGGSKRTQSRDIRAALRLASRL